MKVGLIDVDMESRGKCTYPNLALMKLSAWHKNQGDTVEWHQPGTHYDLVYMSRVFSSEYTKDYEGQVDADRIVRGGSGYALSVGEDGMQHYDKSKDTPLSDDVFHTFPDYAIYEQFGIKDTAYGFLTRGCPRGCDFCHVKDMQGRCVTTVSRLSQFWNGQKNISLLDPNITASKDYFMHMKDLAQSKAAVDFSQGLDVRMLTRQKIEALNDVKWKALHFAWDRPKDDLKDKFALFKEYSRKYSRSCVTCYILTNFDSTHEEDMMRVNAVKECGIHPYVMVYRKNTAPKITRRLQRYCNWPSFCWSMDFDTFQKAMYKKEVT